MRPVWTNAKFSIVGYDFLDLIEESDTLGKSHLRFGTLWKFGSGQLEGTILDLVKKGWLKVLTYPFVAAHALFYRPDKTDISNNYYTKARLAYIVSRTVSTFNTLNLIRVKFQFNMNRRIDARSVKNTL